MLKTPPPSSAAVAARLSSSASTGAPTGAPSADHRRMALLLSAERLYRDLATKFAGPADAQAIKHHLYACFGIPLLHGDMEVAHQVSPAFAAELTHLGTQLALPPVPAHAWLQARACWPQPCFTPHEVHLAMAGVLFAAQAGAKAFRDTAELDLARFREFLVAHFGPVDAALLNIPLTALERCLVTGELPEGGSTAEPDDTAAAWVAAELAQQMHARLPAMPTLLRHRQHSQSCDLLVRHAGHAQQAEIVVNIPLCTPGGAGAPVNTVAPVASPDEATVQELLHASSLSPMMELPPLWTPQIPSCTDTSAIPLGEMEISPPELPPELQPESQSGLQSKLQPESLPPPDPRQRFEHWFGTLRAPRSLLVDFARCVRDGRIRCGNILAIAQLIHAPPPRLQAEHVRQTGLLAPATIQSLEAHRLLRRLTPGVLFLLASGFPLQFNELEELNDRDLHGNAACMALLWNLSANSRHAGSARDIVRFSGLPLANAVVTRTTGLELPHSHSYQWLWQIIEQRMLPQLDTFLAALQRVPLPALVLETLAQVFKAVVDLPDQQHAYQILTRFHQHQLLAHDIHVLTSPQTREARTLHVPLLPYVMATGKFALARWLLTLPLDINRADAVGRTALHYAAGAGHADIVDTLLHSDARLHAIDDRGRTPLHDAAQGCHVDAMESMLTWTASAAHAVLFHVRDETGCTAVDLALRNEPAARDQHLARVEQIVTFCTMLFAHSTEAPRLMIEAIDRIQAPLFRRLYETCLERSWVGNTPFLRMTDDAGRTPLLRALAARRLDIASFLLVEGASILQTSPSGNVLHVWLSAWSGAHDEASRRCMLAGLETLLAYAHRRSLEESREWVNHQPELMLCGDVWRNIPLPLHLACMQGHGKALALLLEHGADPLRRSRLGHSVLDVAIMATLENPQAGTGYVDTLHRVLGKARWTRIVNAPNFDGVSPLRVLLRQLVGSDQVPPVAYHVIEFLCAHGATDYPDVPGLQHVTTRPRFSGGSWGSLHAVLRTGDLDQVDSVLWNDPGSVNDINEAGQTPLMLAAAANSDKLVAAMLYTDELDLMARDALGRTALHYAVQYGRFEIARMLALKAPRLCQIKSGPHLQIGQTASMTPLHIAAQGNHPNIVEFLLSQHVSPMVRDDADGNFLHQALAHGALEVVRLLIRSYPDLLCRLLSQRTLLKTLTPLEYAAHHRASATPAIAERIDAACRDLHVFLEQRKRILAVWRPHRPGEELRGPHKPKTRPGRPASGRRPE